MAEAKISVKYVGKKPFAVDNVAGSGKFWSGAGDVQEVSAAQAKVLLKYPDQWALANQADAEAANHSEPITVQDEAGEQVDVAPESLDKPIEKMSKPQLVALAKSFGKELAPSLSRKEMISMIEDWADEGQEAGVE